MSKTGSLSCAGELTVAVALVLASLGAGYLLGARSAIPVSPTSPEAQPAASSKPSKSPSNDGEKEDEQDFEDIVDGDLSLITAGFNEPCKLVLIVRTDLGMSPGKIAAQCGHATLACYKALLKKNPKLIQHWERTGQAKIALKAASEDQILELEAIAKSMDLCARSIIDAGRTQIAAGSRTVLGIGPAPVALINEVTGNLRLL